MQKEQWGDRINFMKIKVVMKRLFFWTSPVLLAVSLGLYLRSEQDFFLIRDLDIEVEYHSNQEALLTQIKPDLDRHLKTLEGSNIWKASLGGIRHKLLQNPWVEEVEMSRRFPNEIRSLIKLNPVAFLYVDNKNRIYPILQNGEKLPAIKVTVAPAAPILRNNNIMKDPEKLQKVLALYSKVPSLGALKNENRSMVDYDPITGLSLTLVEGGVVVHFGEDNVESKALQVLRVTDYLQSQKQKARVIDASFSKKVLVRLRKRS